MGSLRADLHGPRASGAALVGRAPPVACAAAAPTGRPGVQLVSVDGDGRPVPDRYGSTGLPKRSIGAMRGAVCVLGLPAAATWLRAWPTPWPWRPACPFLPSLWVGRPASRIPTWLPGWPGRGPCVGRPGRPRKGLEAARILAGRVDGLGGKAFIERVGSGNDPGEAGAAFGELDAAAVEA